MNGTGWVWKREESSMILGEHVRWVHGGTTFCSDKYKKQGMNESGWLSRGS